MNFIASLFSNGIIPEHFSLPKDTVPEKQVVSTDSLIVANLVRDFRGMHIEVNGHSLQSYPVISGLTISADSQHLAYIGFYARDKLAVVLDDKEHKPWQNIGNYKSSDQSRWKTRCIYCPKKKSMVSCAGWGSHWGSL